MKPHDPHPQANKQSRKPIYPFFSAHNFQSKYKSISNVRKFIENPSLKCKFLFTFIAENNSVVEEANDEYKNTLKEAFYSKKT